MNNFLIRLLIFGLSFAAFPIHAQVGAEQEGETVVSPNADDDIVTGSVEQELELSKFKSGTTQKNQPPEFGFCYKLDKLHYWGGTFIERDLQKARWPQSPSVMGTNVDQNQWIEIDLCARTMMAEIGTEPACGTKGNLGDDAYAVALARIIANRASDSLNKAKKLPQGDNINAVIFPTKTSVEERQQFSVWNRNAKVREGTACPERTGASANNWKHMIYLCRTAILEDGRRIRMRTAEMTNDMKYYTSGCRMHYARLCEGWTKLTAYVSGTPINNYRCFELWAPAGHSRPSEEQTCIAKAKTCCTQPYPKEVEPAKNGKPAVTRMIDPDTMDQDKMADCSKQAPNWLKIQTATK